MCIGTLLGGHAHAWSLTSHPHPTWSLSMEQQCKLIVALSTFTHFATVQVWSVTFQESFIA